MSIADIFKIQQSYNLHNKFNDQTDWQEAFKIANSFAETSEKHRANRENLATSDWRVNYQNNAYQTGIQKDDLEVKELARLYGNALKTDPSMIESTIAQNKYNTNQYTIGQKGLLGQDEAASLIAKYGFNPDGSVRTMPQVYQAARADGQQIANPYAISPFWTASNQDRANRQALHQAIIKNSMGETIDSSGIRVSTGKIVPEKLEQELLQNIAMGKMSKEEADALRNALTQSSGQTSTMPTVPVRFSPMLPPPPVNEVAVPYRLETQPQAVAIPQEANTAQVPQTLPAPVPQAVDYQKQYNVSDENMQAVLDLSRLTGKSPEDLLKRMRSIYYVPNAEGEAIWLTHQLNKANEDIFKQLEAKPKPNWVNWENNHAIYLP